MFSGVDALFSVLLLLIPAILIVEAMWLLRRLSGRSLYAALANCAAGGFFILALAAAVLGWHEVTLLVALGGAGLAHGVDLWIRATHV